MKTPRRNQQPRLNNSKNNSKKGEFTIGMLLGIILMVLIIVIVGYLLKDYVVGGVKNIFSCEGAGGECKQSCNSATTNENWHLCSNSDLKCCMPKTSSVESVNTDKIIIKTSNSGSSSSIMQGSTIDLWNGFKGLSNKFIVFPFQITSTDNSKGTYIYGRIYDEVSGKTLTLIPPSEMFSKKTIELLVNDKSNEPKLYYSSSIASNEQRVELANIQQNFKAADAKNLQQQEIVIEKVEDLISLIKAGNNKNNYRRLKYTLVTLNLYDARKIPNNNLYDLTWHTGDVEKSFYLDLKLPEPKITISVDGKPKGSSKVIELSPENVDNNGAEISVKVEKSMSTKIDVEVFGKSLDSLGTTDEDMMKEMLDDDYTNNYVALKKLVDGDSGMKTWSNSELKTTLKLNANDLRRIPIKIKVTASSIGIHHTDSSKTNLQDNAEVDLLLKGSAKDKLIFTGLIPTLNRQSTLRLALDNSLTLNQDDWVLYAVKEAYMCNNKLDLDNEDVQLVSFGNDFQGHSDKDKKFRFTAYTTGQYTGIFNQSVFNGNYLCLKASVSEEGTRNDYYVLATETYDRSTPVIVNIDNVAPTLAIDYQPLYYRVKVSCADTGPDVNHISGCTDRPFSYSFVSDPLMFLPSIIVSANGLNGDLEKNWIGCPDLYENSQWYDLAKPGRESLINNVIGSGELKVICVRAKDSAGNYALNSDLLWSPDVALTALVETIKGS